MPFANTVCLNRNEATLYKKISSHIFDLGFDIVRLRIASRRQKYFIQVLIERAIKADQEVKTEQTTKIGEGEEDVKTEGVIEIKDVIKTEKVIGTGIIETKEVIKIEEDVKNKEKVDQVKKDQTYFKRIEKKAAQVFDYNTVFISDCHYISKEIKKILDTSEEYENLDYRLEVSSTGIDRPLTKREDFDRFVGHIIKVATFRKINNKSRFRCRLDRVLDDAIECIDLVDGINLDKINKDKVDKNSDQNTAKKNKNGGKKIDVKKEDMEERNEIQKKREGEKIVISSENISEAKLCLESILKEMERKKK